jgi:hypothetical protein
MDCDNKRHNACTDWSFPLRFLGMSAEIPMAPLPYHQSSHCRSDTTSIIASMRTGLIWRHRVSECCLIHKISRLRSQGTLISGGNCAIGAHKKRQREDFFRVAMSEPVGLPADYPGLRQVSRDLETMSCRRKVARIGLREGIRTRGESELHVQQSRRLRALARK